MNRDVRRRPRKLKLVDYILLGSIITLLVIALMPGGLDRIFPSKSSATGSGTTAQSGSSRGQVPYFPGDEGKTADQILKTAPETELVKAIKALPTGAWDTRKKYDRNQYGQRWADVDRNGCDTRNDILARDLQNVQRRKDGCVVLSGQFTEPYTGKHMYFKRGEKTSAAIQIDHVVALSNAWKTGAQTWDVNRREQFANDPLNLLAADGPANQDKGDKDAANWLPANSGFHCQYVALQVAVKQKWHLWVTDEEKKVMAQVATTCPKQGLPNG